MSLGSLRTSLSGFVGAALIAGCQGPPPPTARQVEVAARLMQEEVERNARVRIAFDPAREALIAEEASALVSGHALDLAWQTDPLGRGYDGLTAVRPVADEVCDRGGKAIDRRLGRTTQIDRNGPCLLQTHEPPGLPVLHIVRNGEMVAVGDTRVLRVALTFVRNGRDEGRIVVFTPGPRDESLAAEAIAKTIGLTARTRTPLPNLAALGEILARSERLASVDQASTLKSLIEGGPVIRGFDPALVTADALVANADPLIQAKVRDLRTPGHAAATRSRLIGDLLSRLPSDEWRRQGPAILALLAAPSQHEESELLIARSGSLGSPAIPVLASMANRSVAATGRLHYPLARAMCEVGSPGASAFSDALVKSWVLSNEYVRKSRRRGLGSSDWRRGERLAYGRCRSLPKPTGPTLGLSEGVCWRRNDLNASDRAVYMALLRTGLRQQADSAARHSRMERYSRQAAKVGPRSPASVCTGALLY